MDTYVMWGAGIIISIVGAIIANLLAKKDAAQEKEINSMREHYDKHIAELWEKHNADVSRLSSLELHVAREHYLKPELDSKFERLEGALDRNFKELGNKFDTLAMTLMKK